MDDLAFHPGFLFPHQPDVDDVSRHGEADEYDLSFGRVCDRFALRRHAFDREVLQYNVQFAMSCHTHSKQSYKYSNFLVTSAKHPRLARPSRRHARPDRASPQTGGGSRRKHRLVREYAINDIKKSWYIRKVEGRPPLPLRRSLSGSPIRRLVLLSTAKIPLKFEKTTPLAVMLDSSESFRA